MFYVKLNMPDWSLSTSHLSLEEEGLYFRVLRHYYDTEKPIPADTDKLVRRLRLVGHRDLLDAILEEFFDLVDGEWRHKRCDAELAEYHAKAETSRKNGRKHSAKNGRSAKAPSGPDIPPDVPVVTQQDPAGTPTASQQDSAGNPVDTLTTNHKPLTINQEEINTPLGVIGMGATTGQKALIQGKYSAEDMTFAKSMWGAVQAVTGDRKPPDLESWARDVRLIREIDGRDLDEMRAVFHWANEDTFWQANILSPGKLRKQFITVRTRMRGQKRQQTNSTRGRSLKCELEDRSWAT